MWLIGCDSFSNFPGNLSNIFLLPFHCSSFLSFLPTWRKKRKRHRKREWGETPSLAIRQSILSFLLHFTAWPGTFIFAGTSLFLHLLSCSSRWDFLYSQVTSSGVDGDPREVGREWEMIAFHVPEIVSWVLFTHDKGEDETRGEEQRWTSMTYKKWTVQITVISGNFSCPTKLSFGLYLRVGPADPPQRPGAATFSFLDTLQAGIFVSRMKVKRNM